jgi:P27 family predicted phage terminase small subunit
MCKLPDTLSKAAQAKWTRLLAEFRETHDVEEPALSDRLLLEELVHARERLREVRNQIQNDGLVVPGSKGQQRPHPLLATERGLQRQVEEAVERLGLTPRQKRTAARIRQANALTSHPECAAAFEETDGLFGMFPSGAK